MKSSRIILFCVAAVFSACGPTEEDIQRLKAEERYPADSILDKVTNKKAMIVVAHDDDLSGMAGTVAKLRNNGWNVRQITLTSGDPARDVAAARAASVITTSFRIIQLAPNVRRKNVDSTTVPYLPIPKENFAAVFELQMISDSILSEIRNFEPTVIFSLDNELGGYGHPEHIIVSQTVMDLFRNGTIRPTHIFQSVYPNSMERKILKERLTGLLKKWGFDNNSYIAATNLYGLQGMPEPTAEVNITEQATYKMEYLRSFDERERKTIAFYVPYFEDFDAREYFQVFDREFFRVLDNPQLNARNK